MSSFFSAQLDLARVTADRECTRSNECLEAGVDREQWKENTIERCRRCNRPRTVVMPAHLGYPASVAVRLDNLKEGGARFDYPSALSPFEWATMEALQDARREDAREDNKRQREEEEMKRRMASMNIRR